MAKSANLNQDRWKHHLRVCGWMYILAAVASVVLWNLIFDSTAYRPAQANTLTAYFVGPYMDNPETIRDEEPLQLFKDEVITAAPELEELKFTFIMWTGDDDVNGTTQLSTYMGAKQGDLFLLPELLFERFCEFGYIVPLDSFIEDATLDTQTLDISGGYRKYVVTGEQKLLGIPLDELNGLFEDIGYYNRDVYACIMTFSQNNESAMRVLTEMINLTNIPETQRMIDWEAQMDQQRLQDAVEAVPGS